MPAPAALGILAGLGKLGTKILGTKGAAAVAAKFGGKAGFAQLLKEAAVSGGINFAAGTAMDIGSGQGLNNLGMNLGYAITDAVVSGGAQGLRRGLGKGNLKFDKDGNPIRRTGEGLVNLGASIGITPTVFRAIEGGGNQNPPQYLTEETLKLLSASAPTNATSSIDAQQVQRALVNNDLNLLAGAYMPYTNFQDLGLPSEQAQMTQYFNDLATAPVAVDPNMAKNAAAILGL